MTCNGCYHAAIALPVFRWSDLIYCSLQCLAAHGLCAPYRLRSPDKFGVRDVEVGVT